MRKSALRFFLVTGFLTVTVFAENVYIQKKKPWFAALRHCRKFYTDLTTINSLKEDKALLNQDEDRRPNAWIGLYKDSTDTWKWSNGKQAVFFNWSSDVTKTEESDRCVVQSQRGWLKKNCENETYHFFCFKSEMNLVKEKLTWEEALVYCRHQEKKLVTLLSQSALKDFLNASSTAQTTRVWTSLRYLADTWLWVGGGQGPYEAWEEDEMPHCPAPERHCGAVSLETGMWESWDCADKLNFVCR